MNPVKVIFLDIDGVLNSSRSCYAFGGFPHDFGTAAMARFDHVAIALIRKACELTDASIVLSSTWRLLHSVHECANGLDLPIFDKTPGGGGFRGAQIQEWLDAHPEVEKWVIVDDDSDMLDSQKPQFVQTDFQNGLSYDNYQQIVHLLGEVQPA